MSQLGVDALRAGHQDVVDVSRTLTDDEWAMPSDCDGWRVQDVVAHMANTFRAVADPSSLAPGVSGDLEATQAAQADAHRAWSPAQVLADYEEIAVKGLEMLAGVQVPGIAETLVPMEDAGQYPLHLVANALAFDHFCHLRNDILRPLGPIDRSVEEADAVRVGATLEWLLAGLPKMHAEETQSALVAPLGLDLTGPGGDQWSIIPSTVDGPIEVIEGLAADRRATVTSPATEFILWGTQRRPWRERDVNLAGDGEFAARVLDSVNLF